MADEKMPTYGTSLHYFEEKGFNYLKYQDELGSINGVINARKFSDLLMSERVVLDFGAGTGNLLQALTLKRAVAVEVNPHAQEALKARGIESHSSLEEIPNETIDIVISNHALEHVPYPIAALREMFRVMKPGGVLRICVPIDDWRTQRKFDPEDINHHLNTWSPQLLGNSLGEAGFLVNANCIQILSRAWFPGYRFLYRYRIFDFLCWIYSLLSKRRQILVTVTK